MTFDVNVDTEVSALVGEFEVILGGKGVMFESGHNEARVMDILRHTLRDKLLAIVRETSSPHKVFVH